MRSMIVLQSNLSRKTNKMEEFCCVMSMHDGVVLFTSPQITESLGYPRDMWLGRLFIDFVHPKDRFVFSFFFLRCMKQVV